LESRGCRPFLGTSFSALGIPILVPISAECERSCRRIARYLSSTSGRGGRFQELLDGDLCSLLLMLTGGCLIHGEKQPINLSQQVRNERQSAQNVGGRLTYCCQKNAASVPFTQPRGNNDEVIISSTHKNLSFRQGCRSGIVPGVPQDSATSLQKICLISCAKEACGMRGHENLHLRRETQRYTSSDA
jgi:hypothetical protein